MATHRSNRRRLSLASFALIACLLGSCLPPTPGAPTAAPSVVSGGPTATTRDASPVPSAPVPAGQPTAAPVSGSRIDVSVSNADLSYEGRGPANLVTPTIGAALKARIHNASAPGVSAGVRVRFLVDGKAVDERPCFLAPGEVKEIVGRYSASPWPFAHVEGDDDLAWPLSWQVVVDPDNLVAESDEGNNTATATLNVACGQYVARDKQDEEHEQGGQPAMGEIAPTRDAVSFDGLSDRKLLYQGSEFGVYYDLRHIAGSPVNGYVRSHIYIDGQLAEECRHLSPESGFCYAGLTTSYMRRSPLTVRMVFDAENDVLEPDEGNNEISLTVPVLARDAAIGPADLGWSPSVVSPGQKITLRAVVHNTTGVPFRSSPEEPAVRVRFLVDGRGVDEQYCDLTSLLQTYTATYTVPAGQSAPLTYQVVLDPYNLAAEEDESNNEASVQIPIGPLPGESTPAFSIAASDMGLAPHPLVPGDEIILWAEPRNDSSAMLPQGKALRVLFKVDGQVVYDTSILPSHLLPQQHALVQKSWRIPEGQDHDPVFEVLLDPDGELGEVNVADNSASVVLPLARPDLSVREADLSTLPEPPHFGQPVRLRAVVHNDGPRDAANCLVRLTIDGQTVGEQSVDVPALGMATAEVEWTAPASTVEAQPPVPLTGHSGWLARPSPPTQPFSFGATVDPDGAIEESEEGNNSAATTVTVVLPPNNRLVRTEVRDNTIEELGAPAMAGVEVTLQAGTAQATALTDEDGRVTFEGVPAGLFTVSAAREGYHPAQTTGSLTGDAWVYEADTLYLNNRGRILGKVMSSSPGAEAPLGGVLIATAGYSTLSTEQGTAKGTYALSLPPGEHTLAFQADGYLPLQSQVTLPPLGEVTLNVHLERTTLATVHGTVRDESGNPVPGAKVTPSLLNASGNPAQPAAVTDDAGQYSLQVDTGDKMLRSFSFRATKQGLPSGEATADVVPGREYVVDIDMLPEVAGFNGTRTLSTDLNPWTILAAMPSTFFNPEYNVQVIYGRFRLNAALRMQGTTVLGVDVDTEPDYWYYHSVCTKWDPKDVLGVDDIDELAGKVLVALIPELPLCAGGHSGNLTRPSVMRIAVVSHGNEVWAATPEAGSSTTQAPGVDVDWNDCRIKFYLQVDPTGSMGSEDFEPTNPLAHGDRDKVLIIWNPRTKKVTKITNYTRNWSSNEDRFVYTDGG